jgi:hypothetical protein
MIDARVMRQGRGSSDGFSLIQSPPKIMSGLLLMLYSGSTGSRHSDWNAAFVGGVVAPAPHQRFARSVETLDSWSLETTEDGSDISAQDAEEVE